MSGRATDRLGGRSIRRFAAEEWSSELKSLLLNPIYRLARIAAMQPVDNSAACARMQAWRLASS
jgi:hypothetical protein